MIADRTCSAASFLIRLRFAAPTADSILEKIGRVRKVISGTGHWRSPPALQGRVDGGTVDPTSMSWLSSFRTRAAAGRMLHSRSIEYLPGPLTASNARPPMILTFL